MAIKALALDFDGTLVSTDTHTETRIKALLAFADQTGDERYIASPDIHAAAHEHGSHTKDIIGWVLQQQGLVAPDADLSIDSLVRDVVELKTSLYHERVANGLTAHPGAIEFIDWGVSEFGSNHLSIVTTASNKELMPFIRRYNLEDAVNVLVTAEDTPTDKMKPDPYAYSLAAARMGVKPTRIAALEDSPRGLQSAVDAGFDSVIGITFTHSARQLGYTATHVVDSFDQLPYLIKNL